MLNYLPLCVNTGSQHTALLDSLLHRIESTGLMPVDLACYTAARSAETSSVNKLVDISGRDRQIALQAGISGCVSGHGKHCNFLVQMISARTLPRCQAANPLCCDRSMLKSSGVGATLSFNALHIRFVMRALAAYM